MRRLALLALGGLMLTGCTHSIPLARSANRALLGTWTGAGTTPIFTAQDLGRDATITLKVFEQNGRIVWQMTRVYRGREFQSSGRVARAEEGIVLQPRQGAPAVTYTLSQRGDTLDGTGLGADNRVRTFTLTRTK